MSTRLNFYNSLINKYLEKNSKILVVGSGLNDLNLFKNSGFTNFTMSSFSSFEKDGTTFKKIDINKIDEKNDSYDYVVAHACIHHCSKPHSGILEMYRVARKGVLIIEARDSLLMKVMVKLNVAEKYEISAVTHQDEYGDYGGVDNTEIPNYVYRWTENEVEKLISSFNPKYNHVISYNYEFEFENILKKINNKFLKSVISFFLKVNLKMLKFAFKKQSNLFSFFINKELSKKNKHSWIN